MPPIASERVTVLKVSFNTVIVPTVTTTIISAITRTTATGGGDVTSNGGGNIITRGICWSTAQNPTTANSKTIDGTGIGAFTSSMTGLTANSTYYVRAYATNSGVTGYGDQVSFTTLDETSGMFTDSRDGQLYTYLTIGTQIWMTENLAYLPFVSPSSVRSETLPYQYVYDYQGNIVNNAKGTTNYTTYGVLYNWPAALIACPAGWHLPTDQEWKVLEKNQGMSQSDADAFTWRYSGAVGGKLKEAGTSHWWGPNSGATNSSHFTALPGGYSISSSGDFNYLGQYAFFWSASGDETSLSAWSRWLWDSSDGVMRTLRNRGTGNSVRCLRNN